ncbi:MAG: DegT/DnrJ/EryC1/StrS family aminotransferase [Myxococcales bacterium]|nr:DegT/DnrJ/EryC1/StrS family aminotransferase [Myxococcales bacterium]
MQPVRMVDLQGRHLQAADATEALILDVLRSGRWVGGPVVEEAERAATEVFGRGHAVGVASGTDALALALQVVGIGPGARVAVPALTFFATAGAVCAIGAVPVLVDVDERCLLDADALRAIPRPDAVVPVHLFGNACHARLPGVPTVDDAAQAAGCPTPGGALTATSTYPTKVWSGAGDGGFVLSDDAELARKARHLGNHGLAGEHVHTSASGHVGRNSRLDPVSAAMLLGQRTTLAARADRRRTIAARYDAGLPAGMVALERDPGSTAPVYCLLTPERDAVRERLARAGVESAVYYPRPLHAQQALEGRAEVHPTPMADRLAGELLALPVHAGVDDRGVERVLGALQW